MTDHRQQLVAPLQSLHSTAGLPPVSGVSAVSGLRGLFSLDNTPATVHTFTWTQRKPERYTGNSSATFILYTSSTFYTFHPTSLLVYMSATCESVEG